LVFHYSRFLWSVRISILGPVVLPFSQSVDDCQELFVVNIVIPLWVFQFFESNMPPGVTRHFRPVVNILLLWRNPTRQFPPLSPVSFVRIVCGLPGCRKTREMSSRYATRNMSRYSLSISFIKRWKDAGAFVKPNGMTQYSYRPYLVRNAVFHSSPLAIRRL
jgi:hypothetical protein